MDTVSVLQHCLQKGGGVLHSAMHIRAIPAMGGGFGVMATKTIAPGTLLARIPCSFIITASTARKYIVSCGGSSPGLFLSPSNTIISFLLLIALRHGRFGSTRGDISSSSSNGGSTGDSAWMQSWILSLPSHYDNLLELREPSGEAATDAFLRPSLRFARHREKVIREQQRVTQDFHACQSALPSLLGWATLDQFLWAYNTLMSRGFSHDEEVWALMPWVDYFNYAYENNATMYFDAGQQVYLFVSTRMIHCDEQIFLSYGAYTDMELLLWYGFTLTPQLLPQLCSAAANANGSTDILRQLLHMKNDIHCEKRGKDRVNSEQWRRATQQALGHCFSQLSEADGSHPPFSPRGTWLEQLMAQFRALPTAEHNSSRCAIAAEAASRVSASLAQHNAIPQYVCASNCRIGAMAPSAEMQEVLRHISLSAAVSMTDALRAVCWAELHCNEDSAAEPVRESAVMAAARKVSVDAAALLWLLSVDGTEEELTLYISRIEDDI